MKFACAVQTDRGTVKNINQDSVLVKHGLSENGKEIVMAVVCDGMGGLASGELASATVIRSFNQWFDEELPNMLSNINLRAIGSQWSERLKSLNTLIQEYGSARAIRLGTTFSGILMVDDEFVLVHVGDSRIYFLSDGICQITTDQTFVAREVERGNMTPAQARIDPRRNMLLQCVGASRQISPEIKTGKLSSGTVLVCSDGFRHEITDEEIFDQLQIDRQENPRMMEANLRNLIETVKYRRERDNISAALVRVQGEAA